MSFPADEAGRMQKLASRVLGTNEPDVTVERSKYGTIQVHKTRVTPCPDAFPAGHHWYGDRRTGGGGGVMM